MRSERSDPCARAGHARWVAVARQRTKPVHTSRGYFRCGGSVLAATIDPMAPGTQGWFCFVQGKGNEILKRRKNEPRTQLLKEPGLAVPSNGSRTPVVEGAFCCIFTECVLVSKRGYAEKIWPALAYTLIKISNYPFAVLLA